MSRRLTPVSVLEAIEKGVYITAIVFLVVLAIAEVIARLFSTSVPAAGVLLNHSLLLLGLFAGMITAKSGDHLSIAFFQFIKNKKIQNIFAAAAGMYSVFICSILAWSSVSFLKIGMTPKLIGPIPNMVFAAAMPLAFAVMALRFGLKLPGKARYFFPLAMVLGTAAAFPAIAKIIWGFNIPENVYTIIDTFSIALYYIKLPLILSIIAVALMGAPVFTVLAGITLVMIQSAELINIPGFVELVPGGEPEVVNSSIFSALTNPDIVVIPLFTLTGFILSESRAGHRLVHTFRSLFGWLPGGLIIATVIICAFFTSFTGASGVTILALGGILFTILSGSSADGRPAYPERFSIGLLTSVGCIGLLFPPSLPILLVGASMRTNIIHMFLGALIPGVIMVIAMIAIGMVMSKKVKIPVEPFNFNKTVKSIKGSILEILLPVFLIVGYFTGIFTLVEIGAVSVLYVFIAEVIIHREIKFADVPKVLYKALPIIGGILCIIALASALSYAIVDTQAPDRLADWMQETVESKFVFLLLLNLALLAMGCVMDIFSAILVVLPLIVPLGAAYGIEPVHLGIIFIINMEVGFLTPPVGLKLFLASYRFEKPFTEVCRNVVPFLIVQLIVVLLVTYIPALSTFLPKLF